jgi:hypothetical protein
VASVLRTDSKQNPRGKAKAKPTTGSWSPSDHNRSLSVRSRIAIKRSLPKLPCSRSIYDLDWYYGTPLWHDSTRNALDHTFSFSHCDALTIDVEGTAGGSMGSHSFSRITIPFRLLHAQRPKGMNHALNASSNGFSVIFYIVLSEAMVACGGLAPHRPSGPTMVLSDTAVLPGCRTLLPAADVWSVAR